MRRTALAVAAVVGVAPAVWGQVPGLDPSAAAGAAGAGAGGASSAAGAGGAAGGMAGAGGAGGAGGAAAPAAGGGGNLFSFLCPTPAQLQQCKQKLCACPPIQMLNQMLAPVGALTGGMIGPFCGGPNPAALAMPPTSPEGAAARIMQEEAEAKARRAAIRYLATANCRYYPEAEAALIAGLRGDPVECVRIEAAVAFANGCCCTKKTIAALTLAVNGGTGDGFPEERSECVRAVAYIALQKCLKTFVDTETPKPAEAPPAAGAAAAKPPTGPVPYYDRAAAGKLPTLVTDAQHAVARGLNISRTTLRQMTGRNDLASLAVDSFRAPATAPITAEPAAQPAVADADPGPREQPRRRASNLLELWKTSASRY